MSHRRKSAALSASAQVRVSADQARQWFQELEQHPERYSFDTHAGFRFLDGNFGQVGARFQTRERFRGLKITLQFELTRIEETDFQFRLMHPPFPVWGAFVIEKAADQITNLRLEIGGTSHLGMLLLRLPGVRGAIQQQIQREVEHICNSMETLYTT